MKLEAVTVCVGYADFLAATIPHNRPQFDRWVIVTSPDDKETQKLCCFWHLECVQTNDFFGTDGPFAKARGINKGLDRLSLDGWAAHLDADIALPPRGRDLLERVQLDPTTLYGTDRFMVKSWDSWSRFLVSPEPLHPNNTFINPAPFPLGSRVWKEDADGYIPIGFFQLWNPVGAGVSKYPADHGAADRTDMLFALQWPRLKRQLLPELVVMHLESEEAPMGANWQGRTTRPFGPDKPASPLPPSASIEGSQV